MNFDMSLSESLKSVEPVFGRQIIKKSIKKYKNIHTCFDFPHDFVNQAQVAILESLQKYDSHRKTVSSLDDFMRQNIERSWKNMLRGSYYHSPYNDEIKYNEASNDIDNFIEKLFLADNCTGKRVEYLIKLIHKVIPHDYRTMFHMLFIQEYTQSTVAKITGKTRARICQIKKEISHAIIKSGVIDKFLEEFPGLQMYYE